MPTLESRETVGLRSPRSRSRFPGPLRGVAAHYNGPAMGMAGRPHSECRARWRGIQSFHMAPGGLGTTNGASDIAYTVAVCHHAIAMQGRGPGIRTGANGTNSGNTHYYAIFFLVGGDEEPSVAMLQAADWYARRYLNTTTWVKHSYFKSTSCPGRVGEYVRNGRLIVEGEPVSYDLGDRVLSLTDPMMEGDDVEEWQKLLRRWKSDVDAEVDGVFGPVTNHWSHIFMDEAMGVYTESPHVGAKTVAAMRAALSAPEPEPEPGPYPDVPAGSTFAADIEQARELGLLHGYPDDTFRPNEPLTRAAAAALAVRIRKSLQ